MTVLLELIAVSHILYLQIARQPAVLCLFQLSLALSPLIDNHVINLLKYYQRSILAAASAYRLWSRPHKSVRIFYKPDEINPSITARFGDQVTVMIGGNLRCHNVSITVLEESDGQIGRFVCTVPTVEEVKGEIHSLILHVNQYTLTVVYEQITLLWRYFTLRITLGYKYEFKSISAISDCHSLGWPGDFLLDTPES